MAAQDQKNEETAVLDVVNGVHEAWSKNDADVFVADYLENATATVPGSFMESREQIHGSMTFLFNGPMKGTSASQKVRDVRFPSDETAVVITETGVLIPGESVAPPERTAYATWVLVKQDGHWKLAAYCNSPTVGPGPR
ncbi:SgcJ/EcaC family oxidoreductase [Microbispora sp. NBC_01189]|uniref:SgcJ/EcaC family oxidoreductase n=1 Tax=unclassified Microbispora TaxID=2614687 RepID=UPI002E11A193|nr:SgcJ/EcaC family oxidoreductase [Microbispora sp. NBC_01189]